MVPMPMGSHVTHYGKQVHWDGAKDEPTVLMIAGDGPATSIRVDATGKPAPRAPAGAGGAPADGRACRRRASR